MSKRTWWVADDLLIKDEPLAKSLWEYRRDQDRHRLSFGENPNLISSITDDGKQMPILDMDFPHRIIPSSTPGHTHLYIDIPMSNWKWFWLMVGLWQAGVIELGFFVWSLRRKGNFVRTPYSRKTGEETPKSRYGWFGLLKEFRGRD